MLNFNNLRTYLNSKPDVEECFPFGDNIYVYKLKNKMFAIIHKYKGRDIISFKLEPEESLFLRDFYIDFIAGYHLNKKHWNTIFFDGDVPMSEAEICIDKSYYLVFNKLKKSDKIYLRTRYSEEQLRNKKRS